MDDNFLLLQNLPSHKDSKIEAGGGGFLGRLIRTSSHRAEHPIAVKLLEYFYLGTT